MPDLILLGLAAYLLGAAAGLALVAASPLPAALFWGIGMILHLGLAAAELCGRFGIPVFSGMEGDLRHLAFTLGPLSFALGAIFSLIIPGNSRKLTLFTGIGLAIVIAAALGRLPVGTLPLPLILLGVLLVAVLVGLRYRPVPGRWLLLALILAALAELARYRYLGIIPVAPTAIADGFYGLALAAFGMTANRTR
ncbi:hypothetical protein [Ferrovibrio xuzhouensis]|uniref:Uncharacterized protein n=1 Tax=Ferrovibrio xuzhouensis TaxID=1576914 RepID=A0ABV7VKJ3_9PROT